MAGMKQRGFSFKFNGAEKCWLLSAQTRWKGLVEPNIGLYSDSELGLAYLKQGQMGVTGFAIRIRRGKQYLGEFGCIQNVQQSQKLG